MARYSNDEMSRRVLDWEAIIRADSAMYSGIARRVAQDVPTLELLQAARQGQLEMNLLLGAVQYLLMGEITDPLRDYYPSLGGTRTEGDPADAFIEFVQAHREPVIELISTRRVQTNEVARCSFLLPAYNLLNDQTGLPLALIEVGTSAGLTQNVDRYGYRYTSKEGTVELGTGSPVRLTATTGDRVPEAARSIPEIMWRRGLDIHAVDVTKPDEARWLRALVWADRVDRHERLAAALEIALDHPPVVIGGDVFDVLPDLVAEAPPNAVVVIQHSFVLNQFTAADRERFYTMLDDLAADRPIYRVGAELLDRDRPTILELSSHGPDSRRTELAEVHHHGSWIRWHDT